MLHLDANLILLVDVHHEVAVLQSVIHVVAHVLHVTDKLWQVALSVVVVFLIH